MSEKPTFCPRCRKMHVGICQAIPVALRPEVVEQFRRAREDARVLGSGFVKMTEDGAVAHVPLADIQTKFDKRAYQRDYMRKRRAKAKP